MGDDGKNADTSRVSFGRDVVGLLFELILYYIDQDYWFSIWGRMGNMLILVGYHLGMMLLGYYLT